MIDNCRLRFHRASTRCSRVRSEYQIDATRHLYAGRAAITFVWAGNVHAPAEILSSVSLQTTFSSFGGTNTINKMNIARSPSRQMFHETYANFIVSDLRCSQDSSRASYCHRTDSILLRTSIIFAFVLLQVEKNCRQHPALTDVAQMARRGGRRKVPRLGNRKSCVSSAATEPPGTTIMRSRAKDAKVRMT